MRRAPLRSAVTAVAVLLAGCSTSPATTTTPAPSASAVVSPSNTGSSTAGDTGGNTDGSSTPVADPIYPAYGNPAIDVQHYGLTLDWAPGTKTLTGQATIRLRAVRSIPVVRLDFSSAYQIKKTTIDGADVTAKVVDGDLTVDRALPAGAVATLVVDYHGTPATVAMPSHRGDAEPLGLTVTSGGELWTMQEPYGASTWYPANDQPSDKALYDIAVTVPAGWAGIASGTPKGQQGQHVQLHHHPAGGQLPDHARRGSVHEDGGHRAGRAADHVVDAHRQGRRVHPGAEEVLGLSRVAGAAVRQVPVPEHRRGDRAVGVGDGDATDGDHRRRRAGAAAAAGGARAGAGPRIRAPVVRRRGHPGDLAGRVAQRGLGHIRRAAVQHRQREGRHRAVGAVEPRARRRPAQAAGAAGEPAGGQLRREQRVPLPGADAAPAAQGPRRRAVLRARPGLGGDVCGHGAGPGVVHRVREPADRPRLHRPDQQLAGLTDDP